MLRGHGDLLGSRLVRLCRRLTRSELKGTSIRHRAAYIDAGRATLAQAEEWVGDEARRRGYEVSPALAARLVAAAGGKRFRGYARPFRRDIEVVLTYYSPCDYLRPRQNFYAVLGDLLAADIRVTVAEAVMPGAEPLSLPPNVRHLRWQTDSVLFLKENLFNLTLPRIFSAKVVLLDADVRLTTRSWLDHVSESLDSHDVCQPFCACYWLTADGGATHEKRSVVEAFARGEWPDLRVYHPGFAWGFRCDFLRRIGGLYDLHAVGGGDTSLAFALAPRQPSERTLAQWVQLDNLFHETDEFRAWLVRVRAERPRVDYLRRCYCLHLWHGSRDNRRYNDRGRWLPPLEDGDYPLVRGDDGLLRWKRPEHSERVLEYFRLRAEDE